jgi:hypothetical protein
LERDDVDDTIHGRTPTGGGDPSLEPHASEDGVRAHSSAAVLSLKQAMRRARFDDAERTGVVADLRAAQIGRLEVLQDALKPLLAQIPDDVDCFDVGIMPGSKPRLFIDMIGFVEMARDPRVYRFVQDTRHGRVQLAESESIDTLVEAATHYVARRLLERDKALAAESEGLPRRSARGIKAAAKPAPPRRGFVRILGMIFAFCIDLLGAIAFFSILAFAAWAVWANLKH